MTMANGVALPAWIKHIRTSYCPRVCVLSLSAATMARLGGFSLKNLRNVNPCEVTRNTVTDIKKTIDEGGGKNEKKSQCAAGQWVYIN